jgi:hypothetical protein
LRCGSRPREHVDRPSVPPVRRPWSLVAGMLSAEVPHERGRRT